MQLRTQRNLHRKRPECVCNKECIGFNTRKMCLHVIAVAFHNLVEFPRRFKTEKATKVNSTAVMTYKVNNNSRRKRRIRRRTQKKSPDPVVSMEKRSQTLGELFSNDTHYQVDSIHSIHCV